MELKEFIEKLFDDCKALDHKLVMVRSFEGLPSHKVGNDIDLIVKGDSVKIWLKILNELCVKENLNLEITKRYSYCTKTKIYGIAGEEAGLEIDLNNSFCWRGVDFHSTTNYIDNTFPVNEYISSNNDVVNNYITFCHGYLYGGIITKKYVKQYSQLLEHDSSRVEMYRLLKVVFSSEQSKKIIELLKSGDVNALVSLSRQYRISVIIRSFLKRPVSTSVKLIRSYFYDFFF
jgi:hypothetical protein